MAIELWLAFVFASAVVLAIPGPSVMVVVSHALAGDRRAAWATVPGVALGDLLAMSVSLLGAGALLAASANAFTAMKLAGALYLIYLGVGLWREDGGRAASIEAPRRSEEARRVFWRGFVVTALNPKSIVFFVAFAPQFLDPARSAWLQSAIMTLSFVVLALVNALLWLLAASSMRRNLTRPTIARIVRRIGASCMIGAGGLTALART